MKYILENVKKIPLWSIILVSAFLLGFALDMHLNFSQSSYKLSFQDIVFGITEGVYTRLYYIFLLLFLYIGFRNKDSDIDDRRRYSYIHNLPYMMFLNLVLIVSIIVSVFIAFLLKEGSVTFSDEWNNIQIIGAEGITPTLAMFLSFILFYLRFLFLTALVFTINSRCKKIPFGYMGGLAVILIDAIAGDFLDRPLGVFPFEHSSIGQSSQLTPDFSLDIIISVLYWCVLIAAAGFVCHLINNHKKQNQISAVV